MVPLKLDTTETCTLGGSYDFHIVAAPLADGSGFASTATIEGSITTVGSRRR